VLVIVDRPNSVEVSEPGDPAIAWIALVRIGPFVRLPLNAPITAELTPILSEPQTASR
jgi:hypothetical protein